MKVESQPIAPAAHEEPTVADFDQIEAYANDPANATQPDASEGEGPSNAPDPSTDSGPGAGSSGPGSGSAPAAPRSDGRVGTAAAGTNKSDASTGKAKSDKGGKPGDGGKADTGAMHGPAEPPGSRKAAPGEKFDKGLSESMGNAGDSTVGSRMVGKGLKNKRTGIKIAIVAAALVISALGFFLTFPFKLMHIASVLFNDNFRVNDHIEVRASRSVMSSLFQRKVEVDRQGNYSNTGKFLHDKMANMRIEKFKDKLASKGLQMEFDNKNRFIGIRNTEGKLVTDFRDKNLWQQKQAMGELVRNTLAPHRYLQHVLYTKAMRYHAGISFKFWTKNKAKSLNEIMVSKVRRGLSGDADLARPTLPNGNQPSDAAGQQEYNDANQQAKDVGDIQAKTFAAWEKTKSVMKAHEAGIAAFRAKATLAQGFTGIGMMYCMLYEMFQTSKEKGTMDRIVFAMRAGNMIVTAAQQMYLGTAEDNKTPLDFDKYGELMAKFDGNPDAGLSSDKGEYNNNADDTKDFTQSCAWKRAMDSGPCSTSREPGDYKNYNPDFSEAANPDTFYLSGILATMNTVFSIPGVDGVCKVLNSWFGWVIDGVEVAVALLNGQASTVAANIAKQIALQAVIQMVVPKLLDAATGLAITGSENAVGLVNNAHAGLNLSAKDYGRLMGNRVGTNKENYRLIAAAKAEEKSIINERGWTYRAFALENNHSLVNRLLSETPSTPTALIAKVQQNLEALPTNIAAIFFRPQTALAEGDEMEDPYGFRPYVTLDEEIEKYKPLEVENFLTEDLPDTDQTRLSMLGDPTKWTPPVQQATGTDVSQVDLLHCFVGAFRTPSTEDKICLDMGVLTQRDKNGKLITNPKNPGAHEIRELIYCQAHDVCHIPYNDDFNKYRMYLKYVILTRGLDGLTNDKDPFEQTQEGAAAGPTAGICQTPAPGSDPAAPIPPNNYSRVSGGLLGTQTTNARTKFMLDQAVKYGKQLGYNGAWYVTQGSYNEGGVAASAGTHDGGGALDISVGGASTNDKEIMIKALRMAGFAAWNRFPPAFVYHIHAIAIGDKELAPIAAGQVKDYFLHKDGLAGDGNDPDSEVGYPFPNWAGQICMSMGLAN
jgi:hypothetical protein